MFTFRSFARLLSRPRRPWRAPHTPRRCRPTLEGLEDRCVPATFTVNSIADTATPPAGTVTLRTALLRANADAAPDTIDFAPGLNGQTIALTSPLPPIIEPLTITGFSNSAALTVNGNNQSFSVFKVAANTAATLSGMTITGGDAAGTPERSGGGILNNGQLTLDNVTVTGNAAPGVFTSGGGIYSAGTNSTLTITNSTIANNSAENGAGIDNEKDSKATLTKTTVTGNSGTTDGVGAGIFNQGTMTLTFSTVSNNVGHGVGYQGGGLDNSGSLELDGSTVSGNLSQGTGGGIYTAGSPSTFLALHESTIANNITQGGGGGGVFVGQSQVQIYDSTITGNTDTSATASSAGGLSLQNAGTLLVNTIIAENTATGGPADVRPTPGLQGGNNFIGAGVQGSTMLGSNNQMGTPGAPLNPRLGPLQNNGGLALTRAPLPGSPVIGV